jgi:hypothetical protein
MLLFKILINFWISKLSDFWSYFVPTYWFIDLVITKQIPNIPLTEKTYFCWGSYKSFRLSDDYFWGFVLSIRNTVLTRFLPADVDKH